MSDGLDARWKRLVATARRAPVPGPRAPRRGWVEQVARRALLARTTSSVRAREPLAWAGLVSLAVAAAIAVVVWPGPVTSTAGALATGAGALPRSVPHAPRLPRSPPAPHPPLPELTLELPFLPRRTVTP